MPDKDFHPSCSHNLWDNFHLAIRSFICKRVSNPQDAEDILQEVFYKIYSKIDGLKDHHRIQAWVYSLTRNAIIDYYRQQEKSVKVGMLSENLAAEAEAESSANREISMCLRAMVDQLPDKYKQAIILTEFENMTQKQLAESLGLSVSGAKSRVQRGRAMLMETLFDCCSLEFDRMSNIIDYEKKTQNCKYC